MTPKYKKGDVLLDMDEFKEYKITSVNSNSNGIVSYIVERKDVKIFYQSELDKFELLTEEELKNEPKKTSQQSKKREQGTEPNS